MAKFEIQPRVIYPKNPVIRFARADLLEVANHARVGFEITLSIFSALVGAHLSSKDPVPLVHWLFEVATLGGWISFLIWSVKTTTRAHEEAEPGEQK